jgi:fumarate reductase subunit C
MSAPHTPYHPRWHRSRVSVWWWLEKPAYALFVLRELTSVFVALFALLTLAEIRAVARGPDFHAAFLARLAQPPVIAFHAVALLFVLYHSITWFNLAPKAMVVRLAGRRVPDAVIAGSNYLAWLALSAAVAFVMLRS